MRSMEMREAAANEMAAALIAEEEKELEKMVTKVGLANLV